ncbi:MAG TPA: YifB family Mg chelatase-like AAA ATPase [Armatimonadota bacterium]|jgi:magnesium chelatase family protein
MLAQVDAAAILGIDAFSVQVQVDAAPGEAKILIVGLPDTAVREAGERVRTALRNSQFKYPTNARLVVNLAPADVRKEGPSFDLPIALGILMATGQVTRGDVERFVVVGELSLDGSVRAVSGILPIALGARDAGKTALIVPQENAAEAAVVEGIEVYPVASLAETIALFQSPQGRAPHPCSVAQWQPEQVVFDVDLSEVKGQEQVKRALEVAAAGGHNMIMIGPPGSGKTLIARRLPTILPPLTLDEALAITKIYSIAGMLPGNCGLMCHRPFRAPHHTISSAGLVGGGSIPRPGEISLAHQGVLFLDEFPEFDRRTLEVLRQPLEDGHVTISRAAANLSYPARLQLISSMNPCQCGFLGDLGRPCTCSATQVAKYQARISGPILDRLDIHIEVPRLRHDELMSTRPSESSHAVRERVVRARNRQTDRFAGTPITNNAQMRPRDLREFCPLANEVQSLLRTAIDQLHLSARAYDRIIKLARTIADLEESEHIAPPHLAEAIQYRNLDRGLVRV